MKKLVSLFLSLVMVGAVLCGCGGGSSQGDEGSNGVQNERKANNEIVVAIAQDLEDSLDPHASAAAGTREVLFNVYEGLVKTGPDGELIPAVAERYDISDDGLVYTFTLREGVKFHNGDPVTAEDVIYSINRCAGNSGDSALVSALSAIQDLKATDERTVTFRLEQPDMELIYFLTAAIIPQSSEGQTGFIPGTGPFHSQSLEALFAHYPGLHVMTPATVADAYWMLRQAVEIPDPVIFLEHKFLYRWLKAEDNYREAPVIPFGTARIARTGKHATVVAYSAMVPEAVRAADLLEKESGYEVEVVDLRTVRPLDMDTVIASVARTGRVLVVGEDFPWGGVTAEVVSRIVAEGFHLLDAPPQRLNARDTPIPQHPNLWKAHRPTLESIAASIRHLLSI